MNPESKDHDDRGKVRRLPTVSIDGKAFFKDDRLHEYRAVENPHDRIAFDDYAERYRDT